MMPTPASDRERRGSIAGAARRTPTLSRPARRRRSKSRATNSSDAMKMSRRVRGFALIDELLPPWSPRDSRDRAAPGAARRGSETKAGRRRRRRVGKCRSCRLILSALRAAGKSRRVTAARVVRVTAACHRFSGFRRRCARAPVRQDLRADLEHLARTEWSASCRASSRGRDRAASRAQAATRRGIGQLTLSMPSKPHAAQDERRHRSGQVHAARKPAGRDRAAISRLRQDIGERMRADAVDARRPAFLAERLARRGKRRRGRSFRRRRGHADSLPPRRGRSRR